MKYVESKLELAKATGVNRSTIYKWLSDSGFPSRTAEGWPLAAVLRFARKKLAAAAEHQTPAAVDEADPDLEKLKKSVLQRRVKLLDRNILDADREAEKDMRTLISIQDHVDTVRGMVSAITGALDQWVVDVGLWTKDVQLKAGAEKIRDRIRSQMAEECETLANKADKAKGEAKS